jgi:hypothetical protein
MLDLGPEGWVPTQDYEGAVALCKHVKEQALTEATPAEERVEITVHWPWGRHGHGRHGHGRHGHGRHGRREIYVINRARYSAVLYLVYCYIYGQPALSRNNISRMLLVEDRVEAIRFGARPSSPCA